MLQQCIILSLILSAMYRKYNNWLEEERNLIKLDDYEKIN